MRKNTKGHNRIYACLGLVCSLCLLLLTACGPVDFLQETVNGRLEKVVVGEAKEVETISADRFAYQQLSAELQATDADYRLERWNQYLRWLWPWLTTRQRDRL